MIKWTHFPRSQPPLPIVGDIASAFNKVDAEIRSPENKLKSNEVLARVAPHLTAIGFEVERPQGKIRLPVLYGSEGVPAKQYEVDAIHREHRFIIEVEAGAAGANNRHLLDLIKACLIPDIDHAAIAVRRIYEGGGSKARDYDRFVTFVDAIYASERLRLPLRTVTVIGY